MTLTNLRRYVRSSRVTINRPRNNTLTTGTTLPTSRTYLTKIFTNRISTLRSHVHTISRRTPGMTIATLKRTLRTRLITATILVKGRARMHHGRPHKRRLNQISLLTRRHQNDSQPRTQCNRRTLNRQVLLHSTRRLHVRLIRPLTRRIPLYPRFNSRFTRTIKSQLNHVLRRAHRALHRIHISAHRRSTVLNRRPTSLITSQHTPQRMTQTRPVSHLRHRRFDALCQRQVSQRIAANARSNRTILTVILHTTTVFLSALHQRRPHVSPTATRLPHPYLHPKAHLRRGSRQHLRNMRRVARKLPQLRPFLRSSLRTLILPNRLGRILHRVGHRHPSPYRALIRKLASSLSS